MLDKEMAELKVKLDAIAAGTTTRAPSWRDTRIGKWSDDGLIREAARISSPTMPEWWKHDAPGSRDLAAVNELLERVGVGKIKTRDSAETENVHGGERGITASEVAEHQREHRQRAREGADDAEEFESYLPAPSENAWAWADTLATRVDTNSSDVRPWYSVLLSYVRKFPKTAIASELDAGTIRKLLEQICGGTR
jgi:hypothetical protein